MTNIAQPATSTIEPVQGKTQPPRPFVWDDEMDQIPEEAAHEKDRPTSARLEGRFENWGSD